MGRALPLVEGLGHSAGYQGQVAGLLLLTAAPTDAEATLCIAAAGIQAILAEIVAAFIATEQALAADRFLAMVADGNVTTFNQVQLGPIDEWGFAG
jgi:RecA/RadA recombinase